MDRFISGADHPPSGWLGRRHPPFLAGAGWRCDPSTTAMPVVIAETAAAIHVVEGSIDRHSTGVADAHGIDLVSARRPSFDAIVEIDPKL